MKHVKRHLNLGASNLLLYKLERGLRNFQGAGHLENLKEWTLIVAKFAFKFGYKGVLPPQSLRNTCCYVYTNR